MERPTRFDHLALGVRQWSDGTELLVDRLGGRWYGGAQLTSFSPGQFSYGDGLLLELLAPGTAGDSFVARFLDHGGPRPHHLTFQCESVEALAAGLTDLGVEWFAGDADYRTELFVHPRAAGLGVLIQVYEFDTVEYRTPTPDGLPEPGRPPMPASWVGLVVESLASAWALFTTGLGGRQVADGPGWALLEWPAGHRLLLRQRGTTDAAHWPDRPGVAHLAVGDPDPADDDLVGWSPDPRVNLLIVEPRPR